MSPKLWEWLWKRSETMARKACGDECGVKYLKYRSERKDKREESKQPIDGGAHETCKGEDERATDR
jgi:hypothetical protein